MLWQKVIFLLGLVPNVALTAKVPHVPNLGDRGLGISLTDDPGNAGGFVALAQHSTDAGPAYTALQATLTVPNLTWASGQSQSGGSYYLGVGCSIYAMTDNDPNAACNTRGPHMGVNANLTGDGSQVQQSWSTWGPYTPNLLSPDQEQMLNFTAGDEMFIEIELANSTYATYTFTNLKSMSSLSIVQANTPDEVMCSGDGTTAYAGCVLGVVDTSRMPGFVQLDFEAIMLYDRSNTTHDFDLDQEVHFYRLVKDGTVLAMPVLEEPRDFAVQWSENPTYGSDIGGGGSPPYTTQRW